MAHKSEDSIQAECYISFNNKYKELRGCLFAVPNGGARSGLEGKILKMTGVYPGVSDLIFLYRGFAVLIEMKNETGEQSNRQKDWQAQMERNYFKYYLCRNLETFEAIIEDSIELIDGVHSKHSFIKTIAAYLGLKLNIKNGRI